MGRAAIVAFGAALSTAACSGTTGSLDATTAVDAGGGSSDDAARTDDAGAGGGDDAASAGADAPVTEVDSGNVFPPYGTPPEDAGQEDTGAPVTLYGGAGF